MQIWFFIKWIAVSVKIVLIRGGQWVIGWFILGRGCKSCKFGRRNLFRKTYSCLHDVALKCECRTSITLKHFKREGKN